MKIDLNATSITSGLFWIMSVFFFLGSITRGGDLLNVQIATRELLMSLVFALWAIMIKIKSN